MFFFSKNAFRLIVDRVAFSTARTSPHSTMKKGKKAGPLSTEGNIKAIIKNQVKVGLRIERVSTGPVLGFTAILNTACIVNAVAKLL